MRNGNILPSHKKKLEWSTIHLVRADMIDMLCYMSCHDMQTCWCRHECADIIEIAN